jgi:hypothetical protein
MLKAEEPCTEMSPAVFDKVKLDHDAITSHLCMQLLYATEA